MHVAVSLVPGRPEHAERPVRLAADGELGHQPTELRLAHQDRPAGPLERADTAQCERTDGNSRRGATGEPETGHQGPVEVEQLHSLAPPGSVGDQEATPRQNKGAGSDDAARFRTDLDDLGGVGSGPRHTVDHVAPAVEHEVAAVRGALERGRFPEQPDHVGGQTAGRAEDLHAGGFPGDDRQRQCHRSGSPPHVHLKMLKTTASPYSKLNAVGSIACYAACRLLRQWVKAVKWLQPARLLPQTPELRLMERCPFGDESHGAGR